MAFGSQRHKVTHGLLVLVSFRCESVPLCRRSTSIGADLQEQSKFLKLRKRTAISTRESLERYSALCTSRGRHKSLTSTSSYCNVAESPSYEDFAISSVESSHPCNRCGVSRSALQDTSSDRRLIALLADFVDRAKIGMVRDIAIRCFASSVLKDSENCDISHRLCRPASLS
jgi:hypothetical protein